MTADGRAAAGAATAAHGDAVNARRVREGCGRLDRRVRRPHPQVTAPRLRRDGQAEAAGFAAGAGVEDALDVEESDDEDDDDAGAGLGVLAARAQGRRLRTGARVVAVEARSP